MQKRHALSDDDTVQRTRRSDREYDEGMRKPCSPITFDAILTALAVLSTTTACSKAERAGAEPASATPAATMTAAPTASAAPPQAQPAVPPPAAAPTMAPPAEEKNAVMVDAGAERKPLNAPAPKPTKGASAACGATGCSAEMRKGGK